MLFDCRNKRLFITKDLSKILQIRVFSKEELALHTFAGYETQEYSLLKAEADMELQGWGRKRFCLNVVKKMTTCAIARIQSKTGYTHPGWLLLQSHLIRVKENVKWILCGFNETRRGADRNEKSRLQKKRGPR